MNKVYRAAQFILPPAGFAAVKREQIEWLKKRNATPSTDEKCKLREAPTKSAAGIDLMLIHLDPCSLLL